MRATLMTGAQLWLVSWGQGRPLIGHWPPPDPITSWYCVRAAPPSLQSPDVWSPEDTGDDTTLRCNHRLVKTIILFTSNSGQPSVSMYEQDVRSRLTAPVSSGLSLINSIAVYVWLVALFLVSSDHTINYHPCWLHKLAVIQSITEGECVLCCKQWLFLQFVLYLSQLFLSNNLEHELGSIGSSQWSVCLYWVRDTCAFSLFRFRYISDVTIFHPWRNF